MSCSNRLKPLISTICKYWPAFFFLLGLESGRFRAACRGARLMRREKLVEIGLGEGAGSGIAFGEGRVAEFALGEGHAPSASRFSAPRPSPSPFPAKKALCKRDYGHQTLAKRDPVPRIFAGAARPG